jgi:hypothetical protein
VDIFRQYGDHLYAKGDTAGAIEQYVDVNALCTKYLSLPTIICRYVKTIGTLEPSYVIQRFLDAQKIHQLTAYLQALAPRYYIFLLLRISWYFDTSLCRRCTGRASLARTTPRSS